MSIFIKKLILISLYLNSLIANTEVFLKKNVIHYDGYLSSSANNKVFELYKRNIGKIEYILIKSKGGEVNVGLDLAEFIFLNKISVEVKDYCLSSCANYVFPAAKNKVLGNRALIGFHGGANSSEFNDDFIEEIVKSSALNNVIITKEEAKNKILSYMLQTSKREKEFFKKIKVKNELTYLGQDKKYLYLEKKGFNGWYYSVNDLKKLGLNNITILNGPWKYKQPFKEIKAFHLLIK